MTYPKILPRHGLICFLLALGLTSCAFFQKPAWEQAPAPLTEQNSLASEPGADQTKLAQWNRLWSERADLVKLREFVSLSADMSQPGGSYELFTRLAEAHYILGQLAENEAEARRSFALGRTNGEMALALHVRFRQSLAEKKDIGYAVGQLDHRSVAAIYWTALNLFGWAEKEGDAVLYQQQNMITTLMERVELLDISFAQHGPERFWGVYRARLARSDFGRPEWLAKAQWHFIESLRQSPESLAAKVDFARWYAADPRIHNCQLYHDLLIATVNASIDAASPLAPEQKVARLQAEQLLKIKCLP